VELQGADSIRGFVSPYAVLSVTPLYVGEMTHHLYGPLNEVEGAGRSTGENHNFKRVSRRIVPSWLWIACLVFGGDSGCRTLSQAAVTVADFPDSK